MSSSEKPTCSRLVSSKSVNDKIIEYYLKFAKDRDIEKFMRFSTSNPSKSGSSDESEYLIAFERVKKKTIRPSSSSPELVEVSTSEITPEKNAAIVCVQAPVSVTKTCKKLEWDALGDVGYIKSSSTGNLSSLERSVLKELFSESPSEPNISLQQSNNVTSASSSSLNQQVRRERWRQTLENLGRKYASVSTNLDTREFIEQPQSTPKPVPGTEKSVQTTFDKKNPTSSHRDHSCQTSFDHRTSRLVESSDKSAQTSLAKINPKEVQATLSSRAGSFASQSSFEKSAHTSLAKINPKEVQATLSSRTGSFASESNFDKSAHTSLGKTRPQEVQAPLSSSRAGSFATQSSFDKSAHKSLAKTKLQEVQAPLSSRAGSSATQSSFEKSAPTSQANFKPREVEAPLSSRAGSFATQSSFEYHSGDPDSSKSSTRRSVLSENHSNISRSRQSSDSDKENQLIKRSSKPKTEVDLGIKLLCSLIDAKHLSAARKKSLAKKIFKKIVKQPTSASMTGTSEASRSSVLSIQSLIESASPREDETHRSEAVPSKNVATMSEQTQTEQEQQQDEHPASTSPSLEEPITTREWLHPLTRSEKDYDKKLKNRAAAQSLSPQSSERQKQLSWIEMEINRLEGLKNLLIQEGPRSNSTIQSSGRAEVIYEETAEDVINPVEQYKRTTQTATQNVVIYDEPTTDDGKQPEKVEYKTTRVVITEEQNSSSSGSLKNNRSKLETPKSSPSPESESVSAFAEQLQKQFMDNYTKKERSVSEHYSEPRVSGKPAMTRNASYTSVASSPFLMSSEMSIPIVESSSTTTTTHQYDSQGCDSIEGVAVQTTYSVINTNPIFGPRCKCICTCGKQCKCSCPRPTMRVNGQAFHQTVQVKPKALAYIIRFSETHDSEGNKITEERLTLQQRLEEQKPDFFSKANERQEILKKLHQLRQEREQHIREIADSSSVSSISRKLDQLPPPPISQVRIAPTREMKDLTKRHYRKLPEVVAKQERDKLERRKKTTRVITNIFNKKLQRMVHNGKLSLEFSRTVI